MNKKEKDVFYCPECELGMLKDDRSEAEIREMYDENWLKKYA